MYIPDFKLERYLATYEFSAPYLLCTSDCESLSISELLSLEEGAESGFLNQKLGYTESKGDPILRSEIAGLYQTVTPDEVVVSAGAEEAIFILMNILLKPGDHVIVQEPAYQSLSEIPRAIGCRVSPWSLVERDGLWAADLDALERLITPDTRILVVNSPHNPTGHLFTQEEWRRLIEMTDDRGIRVISDEVYRGLEHDPGTQLPAMADCSYAGISIGVMSKAFGLAGLRIGWIATHDAEVIRRFLAMKDYTTICSSAPSEYLSTVALRNKEKILRRNREIVRRNLDLLHGFFRDHADILTWSVPRAGSTAFPRLCTADSSELFCNQVREGSGVLLLPGLVFGVEGPYFRIGYGREDMSTALDQLIQYLK